MHSTTCLYCILYFLIPNVLMTSLESTTQDEILEYKSTNDGSGNYYFSFNTAKGTGRFEFGTLVNAGLPDEHIMVTGQYFYVNSDGQKIKVAYTANENGYQQTKYNRLNIINQEEFKGHRHTHTQVSLISPIGISVMIGK